MGGECGNQAAGARADDDDRYRDWEFYSSAELDFRPDRALFVHDPGAATGPVNASTSSKEARAIISSRPIASRVKLASPECPLTSVDATANGNENFAASVLRGN
jgi:hypothetical protein